MRSTLLAVAAAALALPIAAQAAPSAAQAAPSAAQPEANATQAEPNVAPSSRSRRVTGQTLAAGLKKAGFTNIQVRPVSFVARATDKNGRLVLMAFRPHSFTAVTQLRATNPASNNGTDNQNNGQADNQNNSK